MATSGRVGAYSVISPRGEGMNPPTTRPMPFSIHTAATTPTSVMASSPSWRRTFGIRSSTTQATVRIALVHIQGTRAAWPWSPRYRNSNVWRWCGMSL